MNASQNNSPSPRPRNGGLWLVIGALVIGGLALWNRFSSPSVNPATSLGREQNSAGPAEVPSRLAVRSSLSQASALGGQDSEARAQAEVRDRVSSFARGRLEMVHAYAKHLGVFVLQDVNQFFQQLESGQWEEASAKFKALQALVRSGGNLPPGVLELWPMVFEGHGVMETARDWPPHALLDYGKAIQGQLPPGTVLLAGSDAARFIPTLMNDPADAGGRVVLTQSSFADASYMNFMRFQHSERLQLPDATEVDQVFQQVLKKQGKPNPATGNVEIGGQDAVSAINDGLVQMLAKKNPETRFAMQESHPMTGAHAGAEIAGPLALLGQGSASGAVQVSPEQAAQSVSYWQGTIERLRADAAVQGSPAAREGWAELAIGQASLLASSQRSMEAESLYRAAAELAPESLTSVARLAEWLSGSGRAGEAANLLQNYAASHPEKSETANSILEKIRSGKK